MTEQEARARIGWAIRTARIEGRFRKTWAELCKPWRRAERTDR